MKAATLKNRAHSSGALIHQTARQIPPTQCSRRAAGTKRT